MCPRLTVHVQGTRQEDAPCTPGRRNAPLGPRQLGVGYAIREARTAERRAFQVTTAHLQGPAGLREVPLLRWLGLGSSQRRCGGQGARTPGSSARQPLGSVAACISRDTVTHAHQQQVPLTPGGTSRGVCAAGGTVIAAPSEDLAEAQLEAGRGGKEPVKSPGGNGLAFPAPIRSDVFNSMDHMDAAGSPGCEGRGSDTRLGRAL